MDAIVAELIAAGDKPARDAFGHVKLDTINPGAWFAKQFAELLGAEKVLVQKSGYFSRAAAPNAADRELIRRVGRRSPGRTRDPGRCRRSGSRSCRSS